MEEAGGVLLGEAIVKQRSQRAGTLRGIGPDYVDRGLRHWVIGGAQHV